MWLPILPMAERSDLSGFIMGYASPSDCVTIYGAGGLMPIYFDNRFARKFPEIITRQPIKPDGSVTLLWFNSPLWSQLSGEPTPPLNLSAKLSGLESWPGTDP